MADVMKVSAFLVVLVALAFLKEGWSSPALQVTVYASQTSYNVGEDIIVFGDAKVDGTPIENATVGLEVRDPTASPVIVRVLSTNASGSYSLSFKLPSEALVGTYTVNVTCAFGGGSATSAASFEWEKTSLIVLTVYAGRPTYKVQETVEIYGNATLSNVPVVGGLVAVEVQDSKSTPILMRVLETDTDGLYRLTFELPAESPMGTYSVHASASHGNQSAVADATFQVTREIIGDIDGDGLVNIVDITLVAMAWGSSLGTPRWDPRCDLDGNGTINVIDITLVAVQFKW